MNASRLARGVAVGVTSVVLLTSGIYVIVDLVRWEWNRATLAALVFLSALVILSTASVLRNVRGVARRLDRLEHGQRPGADGADGADGATAEVEALLRSTNARAAARHFAWLERRPDRMGVFVPVLLGAGVLLSAVAYVIERVAGTVAGGTLDRRTVAALHLDLPLVGGSLVGGRPPGNARRAPHSRRAGRWAVVLLLIGVLGTGAIEGIRGLTQSRPDALGSPGTSTLELQVTQRGRPRPVASVVEDLWLSCRGRIPDEPAIVDVRVGEEGRVLLVVDQAFGRVGERRIVGCLEDFTLDRVLADVVRVDVAPNGPTRPDDR